MFFILKGQINVVFNEKMAQSSSQNKLTILKVF